MILVSECGGSAATSFMKMLPHKYRENLYFYDQTQNLADFMRYAYEVPRNSKFELQSIAPTAEYPEQWKATPQFNLAVNVETKYRVVIPHDLAPIIHNKRKCSKILFDAMPQLNCDTGNDLVIPKPVEGKLFFREERGAGSRSAKALEDRVYACEHFLLQSEWVIDFNTATGEMYPREVIYMKNGADKFIRMYPKNHPLVVRVERACRAIISALKLPITIGNIQLGVQTGSEKPLVFLEAALRLSGSSAVCLQYGGNVLLGTPMTVRRIEVLNLG